MELEAASSQESQTFSWREATSQIPNLPAKVELQSGKGREGEAKISSDILAGLSICLPLSKDK